MIFYDGVLSELNRGSETGQSKLCDMWRVWIESPECRMAHGGLWKIDWVDFGMVWYISPQYMNGGVVGSIDGLDMVILR